MCVCAQAQSIYSPMYVSDKGLLVFDQIPWFKVAEQLEAEKAVMQEERRRFQQMLEQQEVRVGGVQGVRRAWAAC